jgi:hypothetical protein
LGLLTYKFLFEKKESQIIEKVFLGFIGIFLISLLEQMVRQPSLNSKVSEFSKAINLTANQVQKITLETNTNYPISFEISNSTEIEKILDIIRFNNQTAIRTFGDNSEDWKLIIETKNKTQHTYDIDYNSKSAYLNLNLNGYPVGRLKNDFLKWYITEFKNTNAIQ